MTKKCWLYADYTVITIVTLAEVALLGLAQTWKELSMMLSPKPMRDTTKDTEAWRRVTAWLVFRKQHRFLAFTGDGRAISVWARDITEVLRKYPTLTEVQPATIFRPYQPSDWAVILDEAWDNGLPLDKGVDDWYNLLGDSSNEG